MMYILPFSGPVVKAAMIGRTRPLNLLLIGVGGVEEKFSLLVKTTQSRHDVLSAAVLQWFVPYLTVYTVEPLKK